MTNENRIPPAMYNPEESFKEQYSDRIEAARAYLGDKYLNVSLNRKDDNGKD